MFVNIRKIINMYIVQRLCQIIKLNNIADIDFNSPHNTNNLVVFTANFTFVQSVTVLSKQSIIGISTEVYGLYFGFP